MLPDIDDALIDRFTETPGMVRSGRVYFRNGHVSKLVIDDAAGRVTATVRGSARSPYAVDITIAKGIPRTRCSCPIGAGCKHAAATLFAVQSERQGKALSPGGVVPPSGRPAPSRKPEPLPPELGRWLEAMTPIARAARSDSAPVSGKAVHYLVRARTMEGKAAGSKGAQPGGSMKAKAKAREDALVGAVRRIAIEPVDVPVGDTGQVLAAGSPVPLYRIGYDRSAIPQHATSEDMILLRGLAPGGGVVDSAGSLDGRRGHDLLVAAVGTGRAHWLSAKSEPLMAGDPVIGRFVWRADEQANLRLGIEIGEEMRAMIVALAPPVTIDFETGAVRPIETGVEPNVAEQLLRLPPVPIAAIEALAARWNDIAPAVVPPPTAPTVRTLPAVVPTPVLDLLVDKVSTEEPYRRGYYRARTLRTPWALARLSFDYGVTRVDARTKEHSLLLRDGGDLIRLDRDDAAEQEAFERLADAALFTLDDFMGATPDEHQLWDHVPTDVAQPEDFAYFLVNDAAQLRAEGWRIETSKEFPLRTAEIGDGDLHFGIESSRIDWFDLSLGATIDGGTVDLLPALQSLLSNLTPDERVRLQEKGEFDAPGANIALVLPGNRLAGVPLAPILPMLRALLLLAAGPIGPAGRSGFSRHDLGTLAAIEATGAPWQGAGPLRELAARLDTLRLEQTPLPAEFGAALRPYQQTGLDWLQALDGAGFGGLLADDMGLGKTVQTLAHLMVLKSAGRLDKPALIVAPTSVLPNWMAEIERFAPTLTVALLHGSDRHARVGAIAGYDVVLTSYALIVRDEKILADTPFALIIYDEAHNLKNPRAASHGAARRLKADRRIALTGTPVENRLTDAWSLIDLVVPGLLGSLGEFTRSYRTPIEKHGDRTARAALARRLKPFLLRRTKEAVATDLPEKSQIPERIDLAADQMALHESQRLLMHDRIRDEIERVGLMRAQIVVLAALTRLRQICCDPRLMLPPGAKSPGSAKLDRLLEMLDELVPEGRRIILFSQFTSMLDLIKPELDRRAIGWVELTGKTRDRKSPVARFQAGEVPLILVSLKAGGTGLNLTTADTVLLYDPWWNPAIEAQAIDRAHRIGQTKPVFVHRLIARGTIEEKILALQTRKAAIAETLWSEDAATPASLSEEDIAYLLAG